jgi:SP family general alpha glucoside:H+ symporter-like MFS transporter
VFLTLVPTYVSEICPASLRGYMTSCLNLALVVGDLIGNGIIAGTHSINSHWAYRTPLALQWVFPLIMILGALFAPESPWWLVRNGRLEDAEKSLMRLSSSGVDNKAVLEGMIETDRLELEMLVGAKVTYASIFNKMNIRRTEISLAVGFGAVLSGLYLGAWTSYFFECELGPLLTYYVEDTYTFPISSSRTPAIPSVQYERGIYGCGCNRESPLLAFVGSGGASPYV